jgi:hypothetical protein
MNMLAIMSSVGGNLPRLRVPEAVNATETGSGKVRAEQEATSDDAVTIKANHQLIHCHDNPDTTSHTLLYSSYSSV